MFRVGKMRIRIWIVALVSAVCFVISRNFRESRISIAPLAQFATECTPCILQKLDSTQERLHLCDEPPFPPDEVVSVLDRREIDEDYRKFVLLIYLKLYKEQLVLYGQSFEVRETPFLFYRYSARSALSRAFCEVTGESWLEKKFGPEFLPASAACDFIEENALYQDDSLILREMREIDRRAR